MNTTDGAAALEIDLPTEQDTFDFGVKLAGILRAGDLVVLTGELGSGKTTLTQGIGSGLGVRGRVTSPTFIIARTHPSLGAGPALVHVDAYRLTDWRELDDMDLDAALADSVTVVEWGQGMVEQLSGDRLELSISRGRGVEGAGGERRHATIHPIGSRWHNIEWTGIQ